MRNHAVQSTAYWGGIADDARVIVKYLLEIEYNSKVSRIVRAPR